MVMTLKKETCRRMGAALLAAGILLSALSVSAVGPQEGPTVGFSAAPPPAVETPGLKLSATSLCLPVGGTYQLTAALPRSADADALAWSSGEEAVAAVENGLVTALAPGETWVMAALEEPALSAGCRVVVESAPIPSGTVQQVLEEIGRRTALITPREDGSLTAADRLSAAQMLDALAALDTWELADSRYTRDLARLAELCAAYVSVQAVADESAAALGVRAQEISLSGAALSGDSARLSAGERSSVTLSVAGARNGDPDMGMMPPVGLSCAVNAPVLRLALSVDGAPLERPAAPIQIEMPVPAGVSTQALRLLLFDESGALLEIIAPEVRGGRMAFTLCRSGLLLAAREPSSASRSGRSGGGEDAAARFSSEQYDYWMEVRGKLLSAGPGETVTVRALGYDNVPAAVLQALSGKRLTLVIRQGKGDIVIFGEEVQALKPGQVTYPLSLLREMFHKDPPQEKAVSPSVPAAAQTPRSLPPAVPSPAKGAAPPPAAVSSAPAEENAEENGETRVKPSEASSVPVVPVRLPRAAEVEALPDMPFPGGPPVWRVLLAVSGVLVALCGLSVLIYSFHQHSF